MNKVSELQTILEHFLHWNKARLSCFTQMLLALFLARTVNLREIVVYFQSTAQIDSRYKRCKRFFAQFSIDFDTLAHWVFQLYSFETRKYYLTIDRTNWFRGKSKINILTLGIAYEGAAIPVLWCLLDKAGNATAAEHQEIIAHCIQLFGKKGIVGVLADREFASGDLFRWLNQQKIPFYIRIKEGSSLKIRKRKICSAEQFFHDLAPKTQKIYDMAIELSQAKLTSRFMILSLPAKKTLFYLKNPPLMMSVLLLRFACNNTDIISCPLCKGGDLRLSIFGPWKREERMRSNFYDDKFHRFIYHYMAILNPVVFTLNPVFS